jgi:GT2 family glycosyltransferase
VLFAPRELPPLRPDVSEDPRPYDAWVRSREVARRSRTRAEHGPPLHLVMVASGGSDLSLVRTFESLDAQTDATWTLTIVAREQPVDARARVAASSRRRARRVKAVAAPAGTPFHALLRLGLPPEIDAIVALLFAGDVWAPQAVATLRAALRGHGVAYADEDRIDADGRHVDPVLKPVYSPDFLLTAAYVGRPLAFRADLLGPADLVATDIAELEHECALRVCEAAQSVRHVPEVLCHRTDEPATPLRHDEHVRAALQARGDTSAVRPGRAPGTFEIVRTAPQNTAVSVVIPFRDEPRFLRTCIDSVRATAGVADLELILIDNGSCQPETATLLDEVSGRAGTRVIVDPRPFNWAALNNMAARQARGEVLLFLNNDIEAHRVGWLDALCAQALRPEVGVAGARLLYPDRRLQHCGVVVGLTGAAGHPLVGLAPDAEGYLHMATVARECAAVTGACLATRRDVFERLDGFDESLGVDLNDVDYCLRAWRQGYRVIYEPRAELIHHESPSRGTAGGVGDIISFLDRWKEYIEARDPYLNPHLTRDDPSCALVSPGEREAWSRWHSTLMTQ